VEDRANDGWEEHGLVGRHLDLDSAERLALPGKLHADDHVFLPGRVVLPMCDPLDDDRELPGG
jgi:hypothetical protein